ncbi:MAG: Ig-like domain-containing protein [Lachnospiraceae bacterium]|nr:Ig-like domain-containing protein [Lachnospiraceae bacterium]
MFDSLKMKLTCGVTAAAVVLGSLAAPVNVWADDYDDFLDYLIDTTDDEDDLLSGLHDHDGDHDVDEDDIAWAFTVDLMDEMERQHQAELEEQRKAALAAQAELDALKKAQAEKEKSRKVSGIWVSTTELTLTPGQTFQIIAGVKPDTAVNRGIHFYTSDWNTASVDGSGIVKANNVGSCIITAVSDDGGYKAFTAVRVNPAPTVAAQTIAQDANWTAIAANMIATAAPGAVVNLVAPKPLSFDALMLNTLKTRPDVGLLIAYPYNGHSYLMAIPAGYDLTSKIDKKGKVSFLSLAAVKDGKIVVTMTN